MDLPCKKNWKNIILKKNLINDFVTNEIENERTFIHSIDILNNDKCINDEIHTYENDNYNISLPFFGSGYDIINNNKIQVSKFIYDTYDNCTNNIENILKFLNLYYTNKIHNILKKYKSEYMCIWNKKNEYFIQWIMISIEDYILFLEDFNYKEEFIKHIKDNCENYRNISHEITIVYNDELIPYRSGFYGCL